MTFFDSIKTVFRKYATFEGRATRPEFWWWVLFSTLVSAALNAIAVPIAWRLPSSMMSEYDGTFGSGSFDYGTAFASGMSTASLSGLWGIAVLLPSLAVTVRRLRDAGRSWAELFWVLLPIAGIIILIVHLCDRSVAAPAAPTPPAPPAPPVDGAVEGTS